MTASPNAMQDPEAVAAVDAIMEKVLNGIPWMRHASLSPDTVRTLMISAYHYGARDTINKIQEIAKCPTK